jgi:hypothetical protein
LPDPGAPETYTSLRESLTNTCLEAALGVPPQEARC